MFTYIIRPCLTLQNTKCASLKLPTLDGIPELQYLPALSEPCAADDIRYFKQGDVMYVAFDFYNGAMDTDQAKRLMHILQTIDRESDVKAVALLGGERFFSTG